jgi:hypothetical protein
MNSAGFATFFNQMRCVFISFDLNPLTLATAKCEPQNSSTQTQPTPENEPTSSLTAKQEFCLLLLQSLLVSPMDSSFIFPPASQGLNMSRGSSTSQQFSPTGGLSTYRSSAPSSSSATIVSNTTTHYPTPQQVAGTQRGFSHHTQTQQSPQHVSPHCACSPNLNTGRASPVYDPMLFDLPRLRQGQTGLAPSFVDMVANDFGFGDSDQEFRAGLHSFAQVSSHFFSSLFSV